MLNPQIFYVGIYKDKGLVLDLLLRESKVGLMVQEEILSKIPNRETQVFMYQGQQFGYFVDDQGQEIVAVSDEAFNKESLLLFLTQIRGVLSAKDFSETRLKTQLQELTKEYNLKWQDKTEITLKKTIQTKQMVQKNIENLLQRNLQIRNINFQSDKINTHSEQLISHSQKLKLRARRQLWMMLAFKVIFSLALILFFLFVFCGISLSRCF